MGQNRSVEQRLILPPIAQASSLTSLPGNLNCLIEVLFHILIWICLHE